MRRFGGLFIMILLSATAGAGGFEEGIPAPEVDLDCAADVTERKAVLAGGCFWCVEAVFEQLEGVSSVASGYAGGGPGDADYKSVSSGSTSHAEAVEVTYDPRKISYGKLLQVFFSTHDPTTLNRQGPDIGPQYRSAIFYSTEDEKRVAEAYIRQLNSSGRFKNPLVTTVEPLGQGFFEAEQYHQDFARRNPGHPYIKAWSDAKVNKVCRLFPDDVKGGK
jgi:methionine-S-sulfoxide reductase